MNDVARDEPATTVVAASLVGSVSTGLTNPYQAGVLPEIRREPSAPRTVS